MYEQAGIYFKKALELNPKKKSTRMWLDTCVMARGIKGKK